MTRAVVRNGAPPSRSDKPMAMGEVTDFGASDAAISCEAPSSLAIATTLTIATTEPTQSEAAIGRAVGAHALEIPVERHGEGDGGRAEQEMDELRPGEIGLVIGPGRLERDNDEKRGQSDQIDRRMAVERNRNAVGDDKGDEGQGQPGQRAGRRDRPRLRDGARAAWRES